MTKIKLFNLPNLLTCSNLISGCIGVVFAFRGNLEYAAFMIWLGAFFDFFDGFAARLIKADSELGKQLDSLADMITFGLLPSVLYFQLLERSDWAGGYLPYLAFIMAAFSGLRLAKFNIDTRQSMGFIGMPTPANAIFVSALPYFIRQNIYGLGDFMSQPVVLLITLLCFSSLLVSEIPMMALKFKTYDFKSNVLRYSFLATTVLLLALFQLVALPFIILFYILVSVASNFSQGDKG